MSTQTKQFRLAPPARSGKENSSAATHPQTSHTSPPENKAVRPIVRPPLPEAHADVALCDMVDLEALTRYKRSWILKAVREGRFPEPLRFGPRCSRWRLIDVREWLVAHSAKALANSTALATANRRRASAASSAAAKKRRASRSPQLAKGGVDV